MTAPPVQPETSAHAVAVRLACLLPPMHHLLRPGRPHALDQRHEPPTPEMRGQMRMMAILRDTGQLTMNDLAAAMNVTPPTVTGIVKRLVTQGNVIRIPDPEDGRTVRVELTGDGRARMDALRARHVARLERLLAHLDDDDRAAIDRAAPALERLLAVARSAEPVDDRLPDVREV